MEISKLGGKFLWLNRRRIGDRLQTRQIDDQFKELMLKSSILDRMTRLGMPYSVKVSG